MRRRSAPGARLACLGILCLCLAKPIAIGADAGTMLHVAPTTLWLAPEQQAAELSLSNAGDRPLRAQVRLYRWDQADGEDRLVPTRDLAVSPPLFEIAPQQHQLVRVIRLSDALPAEETSYRLIIDQLPRQQPGPQAVLRYSTPVFAAAPEAGTADLVASVVRANGRWLLRIDNLGTRHARLADLAWTDALGQRVAIAGPLAGYVLPGRYRCWPLPERPEGYADGGFQARIDRDRAEQTLALRQGTRREE